ncbi:hypothetical protein MPSEU_000099200 [Mayamaea pseudoterrestris]|nr:hypothetical protein MPSEU_000099200 [Mayamaea pseudoterrestris]
MPYAKLRTRRRLVIGGHNVEAGRYPYFASIDKNNGVVLNGALIAPDIVLTAGHIATNNMDNLTLKIGAYDVHPDAAHESLAGEEIRVEGWIMHSNWSQFAPEFFANDFCILKLSNTSKVRPLRINRNPLVPLTHSSVIMLGLGWTNESYPSPSSIVQEVDLLTVANEACQNSTDAMRGLTYDSLILPSMICTTSPPNTTRDGCAWDSGAPVILTDGYDPRNDLLVALGSTGYGCADPIFPSIQARVSEGYDWIEEQVCTRSVNPPKHFNCRKFKRSDNDKENIVEATTAPSATTFAPTMAVAPEAHTPETSIIPPPNANETQAHSVLPVEPEAVLSTVSPTVTARAPVNAVVTAAPTSTDLNDAGMHLEPWNASALATEGQPRMSMLSSDTFPMLKSHSDQSGLGHIAGLLLLAVILVIGIARHSFRRQRRIDQPEQARLIDGMQPPRYSGTMVRE